MKDIVADNYYTSLGLAKYLNNRKTDLCCTLRKNKKFCHNKFCRKKLKRGGVIAGQLDNYVTVLEWHDKRDVLMISTCDDDEMVPTYNWRRDETLKPRITVEYNTAKKGIDVSDQL